MVQLKSLQRFFYQVLLLVLSVQLALPVQAATTSDPTGVADQQKKVMQTMAKRYAMILKAKKARQDSPIAMSEQEEANFNRLQKNNLEAVLKQASVITGEEPERPELVESYFFNSNSSDLALMGFASTMGSMLIGGMTTVAVLISSQNFGHEPWGGDILLIPLLTSYPLLTYFVIDPLTVKFKNLRNNREYQQLCKAWEWDDVALQPFYSELISQKVLKPSEKNPRKWLLNEVRLLNNNTLVDGTNTEYQFNNIYELKAQLRKLDQKLLTYQTMVANDPYPMRDDFIQEVRGFINDVGLQDPRYATQKQLQTELVHFNKIVSDYQNVISLLQVDKRLNAESYINENKLIKNINASVQDTDLSWRQLAWIIEPMEVSETGKVDSDFVDEFKNYMKIYSPTLFKILKQAAVNKDEVYISVIPQMKIQAQTTKTKIASLKFHMQIRSQNKPVLDFQFPFHYYPSSTEVVILKSPGHRKEEYHMNPNDYGAIEESLNLQFEQALNQQGANLLGYISQPALLPATETRISTVLTKDTAIGHASCNSILSSGKD